MEEEELVRELPEGGSPSTSGSPLGSVVRTLLGCRPRHLSAAISRLGQSPSRSSSGAPLDESLCFLWRQVEDAAKREEPMDEILIPMIEQFRERKYSKQVLVLIRWLCAKELLHQAILSNLSKIIMRKKDHFIAFGWCMFVKSLLEFSISQISEEGNKRHHIMFLKILCQSIPGLLSIICEGSTLMDGFELPTRLSAAAANCTLVLTQALANKSHNLGAENNGSQLTESKSKNKVVKLQPLSECGKEYDEPHLVDLPEDLETEFLLWSHLDGLIILVEKLQLWSRKSLPLHEKGLKQVLKWLQELKQYYVSVHDGTLLKSGVLLLASCWKHYGLLLRLENSLSPECSQEMLDQYLSALELFVEHDGDGDLQRLASAVETRQFFLNCIALLWGRLHGVQFEVMVSQVGIKFVNVLLSQLKCGHHDVVEVIMSIIRSIIFRTGFSSGSNVADAGQLEAVLPLLLSLLDERDSTAKAVVLLMAELCHADSDGRALKEMCKYLSCGTRCQKKNAIDVILELVRGHRDSVNEIFPSLWQDIAKNLLESLGDEELIDQVEASNLFPYFDPSIVLPRLVQLSYSENARVHYLAASTLVAVLKNHNENFEVVEVLLDSLSALSQDPAFSQNPGNPAKSVQLQSGSKLDIDYVLRLTPKWTENVKNRDNLIDRLIKKMFLNPSNAVLVRFMSYLSEQLAEAGDFVFQCVLSYMREQEDMNENWIIDRSHGSFAKEDASELRTSLFNRLCPLLIIKLIPLKVFDDLESPVLYGELYGQENLKATEHAHMTNRDSIAALLFNRAFGLFEYEDVRKVAAELCGRLHPQVLLPVVQFHLDGATKTRDILKLKACLFSVCTSLMARGSDLMEYPSIARIREVIDFVLSWPSVNADEEVAKAQHGCIDCLALMICAEVQTSERSSSRPSTMQEARGTQSAVSTSVLTCVIEILTSNEKGISLSGPDPCAHYEVGSVEKLSFTEKSSFNASASLTFRLCMANVLISACEKVESSRRYVLANRIIPALTSSLESIGDSDITAACLQVLFSAVYHLKSSVLPYSSDLLKLSIKALKRETEKEKIAAAKLLASLMASEDDIVESLSAGLLEAKVALAGVLAANPPVDLRQLCGKLLACVTSPLDSVFRGT